MQSRNSKTYLPDTYQQYLLQKKKQRRSQCRGEIKAPQPTITQPLPQSNYSQYESLFEELTKSKFQSIRVRMEQEMKLLKEVPLVEIPPVSKLLNKLQIQSVENIECLRREIGAKKRNLQKLEQILSFNKFFVILNKEKRWRILEQCELQAHAAGEIVYSEGDSDQYMYVIVKGCVKQYEKKPTSFNAKLLVNFLSHYQGNLCLMCQFWVATDGRGGEGEATSHDINYVVEYISLIQAYLLRINNAFYKQLISNTTEDDYQTKLTAVIETSIFRQCSKMFVSPLLPTLERMVLPYGQVLVKQGDQLHCLYFIAEGSLQVVYLDRARRSIKHQNIVEKPLNIYVGHCPSKKKRAYSIHHTFYYPEESEPSQQFLYGQKKLINNELEYNQQVSFDELRAGDFLGGKSFLSVQDREKKAANNKKFDKSLVSKLSVLSSSTKTLVYALHQRKFFSLSDQLQKLIVQGILDHTYFDEYDIMDKVNQQREWKKYSQQITQGVIRQKKNKHHSFRD